MGPGEFSRMVGRVGGGIFALRRPRPYSRALRGYQCAMRRYKRPSAGFLIATRCGAPHRYKRTPKRRIAHKSPQTPSAPALTVRDAATGEGMYARMVNRVGGGIFAKTAKTPPLQSALRGCHCDPNVVPSPTSPCPDLPPRIPLPMSRVDSITMRHVKGGHSLCSASPLPRTQ